MPQYSVVSSTDAARYFRSVQVGDDTLHLVDLVKTRGNGEFIDSTIIRSLVARLRELKAKYPVTMRDRDPKGGDFEAEACRFVHSALSSLPKAALADHEFWIWLATDPFADVVAWRFGATKAAQSKNYGVGSRLENMMYRLWLRGEIGARQDTRQYELASSGDQDLWRSHLLRQGYANARPVAQAILMLQAGQLEAQGKKVARLAGGSDPDGVRMLAKRIRRIRSNLVLEYLSAPEAESLIAELSSDLKKGR